MEHTGPSSALRNDRLPGMHFVEPRLVCLSAALQLWQMTSSLGVCSTIPPFFFLSWESLMAQAGLELAM